MTTVLVVGKPSSFRWCLRCVFGLVHRLKALHYHPELKQRYLREQSLMGTMHEIGRYELLTLGERWPDCLDAADDAVA